jgi:Rrf2 family protein
MGTPDNRCKIDTMNESEIRQLYVDLQPLPFDFVDKTAGLDTLAHALSFLLSQRMDATMKLTRTVAYAVRATLQLSQHPSDSVVSSGKLASEGNMPERFLLQILRHLVNHGILRSERGVDGGYALRRPPEQISMLDVIEAIEGPMSVGEPAGDGLPVASQNKLQDALEEVTSTVRVQLEAIKFSQLLEPPPLFSSSQTP